MSIVADFIASTDGCNSDSIFSKAKDMRFSSIFITYTLINTKKS